MNYSKKDLEDAIEANNYTIKVETEIKKKAEKIFSLIKELSETTGEDIYNTFDLVNVMNKAEAHIEAAKTLNTTRKKQLKLIEQMEALENEVVEG